MDAQVIAITHREEDLLFCKMLCAKLALKFHQAVNDTQIKSLLASDVKSYVFIDIDSNEFMSINGTLSRTKLMRALSSIKPRQIFGMADESVFDLEQNHQLGFIGNFLVRKYDAFGVDLTIRTLNALQKSELPGLEHYKDDTAVVQKVQLKSAKQKLAALEATRRLLERRNVAERAIQMIVIAVDELLMNAIFNAPRSESGEYYRKESPRESDFAFNEKEIVTLTLAFSENFASIGILDQFCSLEPDKALGKIFKNYQSAGYTVNEKVEGAGLGLRGIVASGLATTISCKPGIGTEAIISFPYYSSFKETKTGFRSFTLNLLE